MARARGRRDFTCRILPGYREAEPQAETTQNPKTLTRNPKSNQKLLDPPRPSARTFHVLQAPYLLEYRSLHFY